MCMLAKLFIFFGAEIWPTQGRNIANFLICANSLFIRGIFVKYFMPQRTYYLAFESLTFFLEGHK